MNLTSVIITSSETFPLLLLYPKLSSLRNDRSINVSLSDHGKYDDRRLQIKERINVLVAMI